MAARPDPLANASRRSFLTSAGRIVLLAAGLPPLRGLNLAPRPGVDPSIGEPDAALPPIPAIAPAPAPITRAVWPIYHGVRTEPEIALTIDDGWGPTNVRRIFDILQAHAVPATFFPYARAMHLDPSLWRRISDAGFPIGNHTNSHPFMTRLSATKQHFELSNSRHVTEQLTGRRQLRVFRPPYGDWNATTLRVAHDAGFPTTLMWDTTDLDTAGIRAPGVLLHAAEQGRNGSVLLIHGGPALTPGILPSIIAFYRRRGMRFVTVPDMLGLPDAG
jgi:peptidoglycan/xylan/chitin deacetylase (PgdA/CDA1 family)